MSSILWLLLLTILIPTSNSAVVVDNPIILQLSRAVNATGMRNLVAHDRARAKVLREKATWQGFKDTMALTHDSEPIFNEAFCYIAMIGVGNPPTSCKFVLFVF
jgi:hypothetical protein